MIIGEIVTPEMRACGRAARAMQNISRRLAHGLLRGQIERDAADLGFVHDIGRENFHRHRLPRGEIRLCRRRGFVGIIGELRRRHRDAVSREQPCRLDRVEPVAAVAQGRRDHGARRRRIRHEILRQARRRRHQQRKRMAVAHHVHETGNGVGFGRIACDAGGIEGLRRGGAAADPNRQHGLARRALVAMLFGDGRDRCCGVGRGGERGRHVHDENRVVGAVIEQRIHCR
jgi:hypothetical protein